MAEEETPDADRPLWSLADISAACLRVMILNNPRSGIDKLHPYVRNHIEDSDG